MRAPASLLHPAAPLPAEMSPSSSSALPTPEQQQQTPVLAVNSDMVVILASLLCALVCVLGLGLVSRCACRRRRSSSSAATSADPPPKGLKKKAIDALPTVSFGAAGPKSAAAASPPSSSECAICLVEFAVGENLRVLPRCGHGFHVACIDAWLRTRATCPSCRASCVAATAAAQAAPVVVVVTGGRCGRCGDVAPAGSRGGSGDDTFLP